MSSAKIEITLVALAAECGGAVRNIHDVRTRATEAGLVVNYHCNMRPDSSIHDMHVKVDELERALRRQLPAITRVVGHAEPEAVGLVEAT